MKILTASTEDGQMIILSSDLDKEEIRNWRGKRRFYCPQCKSTLLLKVGDIVVPHFAHQKDSSCSASFSEGESPQHLKGKLLLHQLLTARSQNVRLEPFLKEISQRPDLIVTSKTANVPIEFQCSTVPIPLLEERTDGYRKAGMTPIWILHTPAKFAAIPQGVGLFHFSKFQEWFIVNTPPEGEVLLTFNPYMKTFHYFTSLLHIAGQRYIGMHHILPIGFQFFPFVRPKIPSEEEVKQYARLYRLKRREKLERWILLNRKGINDPFLRSCYEMRISPSKLPPYIGVPLSENRTFREADVEWQMRLIYFMKRNRLQTQDMTQKILWRFVHGFENPTEKKLIACQRYISFLKQYGFDSLWNKTDFSEKGILYLISERFLANEVRN